MLFICTVAAETQEIYTYTVTNGEATITECATTAEGELEVPARLGGYPVVGIGPQAFSGCSALKKVRLPQTVTSVGNYAFLNCKSLEEIYIPAGVTSMGINVLGNCSSLKKVTVPFFGDQTDGGSLTNFGSLFGGSNKYDVPKSIREVVILGGAFIASDAFRDCDSIERISVSATVSDIGERAFENCHALKELTVDPDNKTYHSNGNCIIRTKTRQLVFGCQTSVIPADGSVTSIAGYAFGNVTGLKSITVPDQVTKIEMYAFYGCGSLEEITIPFVGNTASGSSNTHFGYIFGAGSIETHNSMFIPDSLKKVTVTGNGSIGSQAFYNCKKIVSFVATGDIGTVGFFAFFGCISLETVEFQGNLKEIEQSAFLNCSSLRDIYLPDSLQKMGNKIFENCNLVKIHCGKNSTAQNYATKNNIAYLLVNGSDQPANPPSDTKNSSDSDKTPNIPNNGKNTADITNSGDDRQTEVGSETEKDSVPSQGCRSTIGNGVFILVILSVALLFCLQRAAEQRAKRT